MNMKEVTGYENARTFFECEGDHHAFIDGEAVSRTFCHDERYLCTEDGRLYRMHLREGKIYAEEIEDRREREMLWDNIHEYGRQTLKAALDESIRAEARARAEYAVSQMTKKGAMKQWLDKLIEDNPAIGECWDR